MKYTAPMLPDIDYSKLEDEDDFFSAVSLIDLEHDTFSNCCEFLEAIKIVLLEEQLMQVPELLIAHLCAYLGCIISLHTALKAEQLELSVLELIRHQAQASYQHFKLYPVNRDAKTQQDKTKNLENLRENTPGSILTQTMRLGRIMMDILEELRNNLPLSRYNQSKQTELFCNQDALIKIMLYIGGKQCAAWREQLSGLSDNYVINQFAIQIGWLMGYFAHLSAKPLKKTQFLEYGIPIVSLYREHIFKLMHAYVKAENKKEEMQIESLLSEIHENSKKAHSQVSPAFSASHKDLLIIKADIEKALIELMSESSSVKTILMSLFYFWFQLEAPLQVKNLKKLDKENPMEHMGEIIELVKKTVKVLSTPEFSQEVKTLNQKMQQLKQYISGPEILDKGSQGDVVKEVEKVNTTILTIASNYLKKEVHPQLIANALFIHWLRLSVFFGVSESDWQKMDYYSKEILDEVRKYLATIN